MSIGRWRVGLVGYGLAGRVFHAPLIEATPALVLSAIVTSDPQRGAQAGHDHPDAVVVAGVDALLNGPHKVDLVVVAAANAAHVPLASRCIDAGIAVVVDKPLAANAPDARRLVRSAETAGILLTVFQNRRWDNDFLTLRRLLDDGRLGQIGRFESRFERWSPALRQQSWRESPDPAQAAGLLFDLGSHLIDQAIVLFGAVTSVYAQLDKRRSGSAVDDDVFVALTHTNGVRSHLWARAVAPQFGPRFRVLGDRAGFTRYGLDPQEGQLAAGLRPGAPQWGRDDTNPDGILGAPHATEAVPTVPGAYQDFYRLTADALANGTPPPVNPGDALRVLEVIEAAQRSAPRGDQVKIQ